MDFNDLVFNGPVTTPEQQAALAASLRRENAMGALLQTTGDPHFAPLGQQLVKEAGQKQQRAITQNYYRQMGQQAAASLAEQRRQFDRADATDRYRIATAAAGVGGGHEPAMPQKEQDKLISGVQQLQTMGQLASEWKDEWSSPIPGVNALRSTVARIAPSMSTEGMKDFQIWRRRLGRELEAAYRHELYGSALTKSEIKQWVELTLDPNADPMQVRVFFEDYYPKLQQEVQVRAAAAATRTPQRVGAMLDASKVDINAPLAAYTDELAAPVAPAVPQRKWQVVPP